MPAPHAFYSKMLAERTASRNVFVLFYLFIGNFTATRGYEGHFDQNFADMFFGAVAWQSKYTNCGHSLTARNNASVCGNPELNNNSGHSVVYSANAMDGPPNAWIPSA